MEKLWVSKTVKKYILSIEQETKEYFEQSVGLIEQKIKEEVLKSPLISSNSILNKVIESEMTLFIDNVVALLDYYVDGVYNSGKLVSRNKLKLGKLQNNNGEKYGFTSNDLDFINRYKSIKIPQIGTSIKNSINNYLDYIIQNKINGQWNLDGDSDYEVFEYKKQQLSEKEIEDVIAVIKDTMSDSYDDLIKYIVSEVLILFKRAQVEEYKNLGIDIVTYFSDDDSLSCPICTAKSGKITKLSDVIDDFGIKDGMKHVFCKYSIDPVINYKNQITDLNFYGEFGRHPEYFNYVDLDIHLSDEIKKHVDLEDGNLKFINLPIELEYRINKLLSKLKINFKQLLKSKTFEFVDNITDLDEWVESVKNHYIERGSNEFDALNEALKAQDNLKYKVSTFSNGDKIYISHTSLDSQPIENIIVRELIVNDVEVDDWIQKRFEEKKQSKQIGLGVAIYKDQFISYLAEESAKDYLVESVVYFINVPIKLESIDKEMFNYIKQNILNKKPQEESIEHDK